MKRELLLMGEVQMKYEEKLTSLKYDNHLVLTDDQEEQYIKDIQSEFV